MIKAFAKFIKNHKDYVFEMYGKCPKKEKEYILSLIKKNGLENKVRLMGERKNIKEAITPARAYICASTSEGMPNAIIEALSYGIPVITSTWAGYDEVIDEEVNGLAFEINNVDQMAKQMEIIANNDALFEKMSNAAFKHRIEDFKADIVLNKWDQII